MELLLPIGPTHWTFLVWKPLVDFGWVEALLVHPERKSSVESRAIITPCKAGISTEHESYPSWRQIDKWLYNKHGLAYR